jgi:large subunit ribosomal protein L25
MPTTPIELRAESRDVFGKHVRRLRRQGLVPANIFGHGPSRAIQAPARALEQLLARGGRTGVISIDVGGAQQTALLKTIQRDPRTAQLVHLDFQAVSMDQEVTATVPVRIVGESPAVTRLGGVMTHPRSEVHVAARAANLPDAIEVDVSGLTELNSAIHISDLATSTTYEIVDPGEEVLAMVQPPKVEVEEPAEEAAEGEAPAAEAESESSGENDASSAETAESAT